jgi:hypothetical protein
MVVSRRLHHKSVCTSPTRLKNLSGDVEVSGTVSGTVMTLVQILVDLVHPSGKAAWENSTT